MINVNKSFVFAWFLIWTILVQTSIVFEGIHAKAITQKSETDDSGHDVKSANNTDTSEYPSLSCVLIHAKGCRVECTMKGIFFFQDVTGECSKNNFCQCIIIDDTSYDTLWGKKFGHDSEDIRDEIRKNDELYEKVLAILQKPFRTGQQIKTDLQPLLTESQYDRLEVQDFTPAGDMIDENNKINFNLIRKFVHDVLPLILKFYRKILADVQYEGQLLEALNYYHGEHFTRLARDIRRTENKALIDILDQFLKENGRKQEAVQDDADISLIDTIEYSIIDEFVENIHRARYDINSGKLPNNEDSSEENDESSE